MTVFFVFRLPQSPTKFQAAPSQSPNPQHESTPTWQSNGFPAT
ncbi:hypothetical protein GCWU000324_01084 [Kingella oralis ATCC 51147]|uniref:Uncharacterized protein n=1 Tax=Kingella oralis ATCC 51147 TaxID=629741 RepID=C4GG17_9NEIS|nr:hypothetical protein GCWU000324_01084 [Kingella oralis ATCC 51147]